MAFPLGVGCCLPLQSAGVKSMIVLYPATHARSEHTCPRVHDPICLQRSPSSLFRHVNSGIFFFRVLKVSSLLKDRIIIHGAKSCLSQISFGRFSRLIAVEKLKKALLHTVCSAVPRPTAVVTIFYLSTHHDHDRI